MRLSEDVTKPGRYIVLDEDGSSPGFGHLEIAAMPEPGGINYREVVYFVPDYMSAEYRELPRD